MDAQLIDGRIISCEEIPIDEGAQGQIYLSKDAQTVIKLYLKPNPDQKSVLEAITTKYNAVLDDPYWKDYFCWPKAIVVKPSLGLQMPRASYGLKRLDWFLLPKARNCIAQLEVGQIGKQLT